MFWGAAQLSMASVDEVCGRQIDCTRLGRGMRPAVPRSLTHPEYKVDWYQGSSFKMGSGCFGEHCAPRGAVISPGPLYKCWSSARLPISSGKIYRLLPEVNMSLVHHMILFAGRGCGGRLLYSWARTGQTSPIGLDFDSWNASAGFGYQIGDEVGITHLSLQMHYQQGRQPSMDRSGLRIWVSRSLPAQPLQLIINAFGPRIPARQVVDNCMPCTVTQEGMLFGWRNHAHKLGRDIWADHFDANGNAFEPIGLLSSQHPQIIRKFASPRRLRRGDMLQLHCVYDNTASNTPNGPGSDETGEMCNQYLLAEPRVRVSCSFGSLLNGHRSSKCRPSPHVIDAAGVAHRRADKLLRPPPM